jgi:SAM-dependent methyltransferase
MERKQLDAGFVAYYEATAQRPPRRTLLDALTRFGEGEGRFAVDLGCGDGRDAVELLRRGWSVLAIDAEPQALERLAQRPDLPSERTLTTRCERFEDAAWPTADFVNASFSLPLCPPARFPALWGKIVASLVPGGRFAGQLYGDRDGWAGREGVSHIDRIGVLRLLKGFDIEMLDEEETDGVTPRGEAKHWHIFHIVARRRWISAFR